MFVGTRVTQTALAGRAAIGVFTPLRSYARSTPAPGTALDVTASCGAYNAWLVRLTYSTRSYPVYCSKPLGIVSRTTATRALFGCADGAGQPAWTAHRFQQIAPRVDDAVGEGAVGEVGDEGRSNCARAAEDVRVAGAGSGVGGVRVLRVLNRRQMVRGRVGGIKELAVRSFPAARAAADIDSGTAGIDRRADDLYGAARAAARGAAGAAVAARAAGTTGTADRTVALRSWPSISPLLAPTPSIRTGAVPAQSHEFVRPVAPVHQEDAAVGDYRQGTAAAAAGLSRMPPPPLPPLPP